MIRLLLILILVIPVQLFGAVGDITGMAISPNGWEARLYVNGLATNGTFSTGFATNNFNAVTAPKLTITVDRQGFDDSGNLAVYKDTVYGTYRVRKAYPNQAYPETTVLGANVEIRVALSDYIHIGDSNVLANVSSGLYTAGGTPNNSATGVTVTNNSASPYPRTIAMWRTVPYQLSTGNPILKVVARHYSAQQMRPVRAVKFWAVDAAGNRSPTNTVLTPSIDPSADDPVKVCEYISTMNYAGFVQGRVTNYFKACPWWGTALDTSDGVHSPDHPDYGPLVTSYSTGGWPAVYTIVDSANGSDGTGTAVTNLVSSTNGTALPFQTIAAAANAAGAANNTFFGSNTLANCYVLLTNGYYSAFGGPDILTRNGMDTWFNIQSRPDVDWHKVYFITNNNNLTGQSNGKWHFKNLIWSGAPAAQLSQGYGWLWIDHCEAWTNSANAVIYSFQTNAWITGCTFYKWRAGGGVTAFIDTCNTRIWGTTWHGFNNLDSTTTWNPVMLVGCMVDPSSYESYSFQNDLTILSDPFFWSFNKLFNSEGGDTVLCLGLSVPITQGAAVDQNVFETGHGGLGVLFDVMRSGGTTGEKCTNVLSSNNTVMGNYHMPYDFGDDAGMTLDHYQNLNSVFAELDTLQDVANLDGVATSRWQIVYSAGSSGSWLSEIGVAANYANPSGIELGFDGLNTYWYTNFPSYLSFTSNKTLTTWGGLGGGRGDYSLKSESPALLVNPRKLVYPFDIDGVPRGGFDPPGAFSHACPKKGAGFF